MRRNLEVFISWYVLEPIPYKLVNKYWLLIFLSYYIILQHGKCMLSPWSLWVLLPCIGIILSNMPFSFFLNLYKYISISDGIRQCVLSWKSTALQNQPIIKPQQSHMTLTSFIGDDCDELRHWPLPFGRISQDTNGVCVIGTQICYDGTVGVWLDFLVVPQDYG